MNRPRLKASTQKMLNANADPSGMQDREAFAQKTASEREGKVKRWYELGGQFFVDWVREHYRTWNGSPLKWNEPYLEEYLLLLGNPWLEKIYVEKAAQVGFSESLVAITAFCLAEVRISAAYGFEQQNKLLDMVGPRIQGAFSYIKPLQALRKSYSDATGRQDTDTKVRKITVGGTEATFFFVSKASGNDKNARQASSNLSSFSCCFISADEIELFPRGSLDVAFKRMQASTLPTKMLRGGSTPGHEGGVLDSLIKESKHIFEWYIKCPYCQQVQTLDAFGSLLKATLVEEDGLTEERYLDLGGRPIKWHCYDNSTPEKGWKTAHIGCKKCEEEITKEVIAQGYFACNYTGVTLRDFCKEIVKLQRPFHEGICVRLPRLASTLFNASESIRNLQKTSNPSDEVQQGLGRCVSVGLGKISLPRLLRCVGRPVPEHLGEPDFVTVGGDQGQASNWAVVERWWLGQGDDAEERWRNATAEMLWHGEVTGFDGLEALAEKYSANYVGIDMKPEKQMAAGYAKANLPYARDIGQVFLFDQVSLKGEGFRRSVRDIQGEEVSVYALDRTFGLDAVRDSIYKGLRHLPAGLVYDPSDTKNLIRHLLTSERQTNGLWTEPPGQPDHLFHAMNFSGMAALVSAFEPKENTFSYSSVKRGNAGRGMAGLRALRY